MTKTLFQKRTEELQIRLKDENISVALITDEDSVYYYAGYYNYLHMDFGRPTLLVIRQSGERTIITPMMELEMAERMSWIGSISPWQDGLGDEWRAPLKEVIDAARGGVIGIEAASIPSPVRSFIDHAVQGDRLADLTPQIADMRMIKSPEEIQIARHAGQVAEEMMAAGRHAIAEGVREYEVALAISDAGTRCAAKLLEAHYDDAGMSPNTHFLQIMASGSDITMPHHRATPKRLRRGDPVFLCFCGMTNFHRFKLGFDRTYWVGEISEPKQAEIYQVALDSQSAALQMIRAGIRAEEVHAAYAEVIQTAGYDYPFRCGRATGYSFLEKPQLVSGDKTVLRPGMVLAVDGSVSEAGFFRAQVGDSILVTDNGYEPLTRFPNALDEMVVI
jgi:Xaa-Pro aminopeptidase